MVLSFLQFHLLTELYSNIVEEDTILSVYGSGFFNNRISPTVHACVCKCIDISKTLWERMTQIKVVQIRIHAYLPIHISLSDISHFSFACKVPTYTKNVQMKDIVRRGL